MTAGKLRHDAFFAGARRALEGGDALVPNMGAIVQQRVARQNLLQQFFSLDQWTIAQILVVEIDEVERAVAQPHLLALGILQKLEARAAACVKRDKLAVDDRESVKPA